MRLFQFNRKNFKVIGIDLDCHSSQWNSKWIWINILYVIGFAHVIIVRGAFLFVEAKTAIEYGMAFYPFASGWTAGSSIFISVWKKENMFNVIRNFEKFIEKSK